MDLKPIFLPCIIEIFLMLIRADAFGSIDIIKKPLRRMFGKPEISREATMTTIEMIENRGYRTEAHKVTTEDHYILELHRILPAEPIQNVSQRKVVYLHHGMVLDGHVWIINANENSLAYMLVDRGFDVWLGNSRGTRYSREHEYFSSKQKAYWNFGWDEMGGKDIPATVQYILAVTNQKKLSYVGYSLGCTIFFIAMVEHPELNNSIESMFALAPTSSLANIGGLLGFLGRLPPVNQVLAIQRSHQRGPYLSTDSSSFMRNLKKYVCDSSNAGTLICRTFIFTIFGHNSRNFNMSSVSVINGHFPAGGSVKTISQFFQNNNSGEKFHRYDYGRRENIRRYGTPTPPIYDLKKATAPVYLFYGNNDPLAPAKDVKWLGSQLGNVREIIRIEDPHFTHGDFVWSREAGRLVYLPIIQRLLRP